MREIRFENQGKTPHVVRNVDGKYSPKSGQNDVNGRMSNLRDYVPKTIKMKLFVAYLPRLRVICFNTIMYVFIL